MTRSRLVVTASVGLAALALGGCPSPDEPPTRTGGGDAGPPAWETVLDDQTLDGAVLSVWGASPTDVYAVGGPLGNTPFESLVMHYDGAGWERLTPGGPETYWWVSGSAANDVWMVGEKGRITHWNGATFSEHVSGTSATIWGVWAASPADAWAVGGTPEKGTSAPNDVVLHWDGSSWSPVALPGAPLGRSLFKVWGESSDDLFVVGEAGTIWHKKGPEWTLESDPPLAHGTLFTVSGCSASDVYAVGDFDVLHYDGAAWEPLSPPLSNQVNGVSCGPSGSVALVGFGGLKQRLVDGEWIDEFTEPPYADLHATWSDGEGAFWAVGGDFLGKAEPGKRRSGLVARFGAGHASRRVE